MLFSYVEYVKAGLAELENWCVIVQLKRMCSQGVILGQSVDVNPSESFVRGGEIPTLVVESTGHAIHVFVNGQLIGSGFGERKRRRFTFSRKVHLEPGRNKISLLSIAVGFPNVGGHFSLGTQES